MAKVMCAAAVVALLVIGMAASAMAFSVGTTEELMTLKSTCDRAGTITMTFQESDWLVLKDYIVWDDLVPSNRKPAIIKVSLRGEEAGTSAYPKLCKTIPETFLRKYTNGLEDISNYWKGAPGTQTVENPAGLDANVSVQGFAGDDFLIVKIWSISNAAVVFNSGVDPWFKFGLQSTETVITDDTPICADVSVYDNPNTRLIYSPLPTPQNLTFDGKRTIGTFASAPFSVSNCPSGIKGGDTCALAVKKEVPNCPIKEQSCPDWTECAYVTGNWPSLEENYVFEVASNPVVEGTAQPGIYLSSIVLTDFDSGAAIPAGIVYYKADGQPVIPSDCGFAAVTAKATVSGSNLYPSKKVRICIKYELSELVVENSNVWFKFKIGSEPCGDLLSKNLDTGTKVVPCLSGCLYFQYTLQQNDPWFTGIAITKLDDEVTLADSVLYLTLTDSKGQKFLWTKEGLDSVVFAFSLTKEINNFKPLVAGTTLEKGTAWLKVQANFKADGYEYITQGSYAASVLSRFCADSGL